MNWADIQTRLVEAVRAVLDDATFDVRWGDITSAWRNENLVSMRVLQFTPLGQPERRYAEEGRELRERIYSPVSLTVQFMVESQNQNLAQSALVVAEQLAAGMFSTRGYELICAAGVGIARRSAVQHLAVPDKHNRARSVATFDLVFNAHMSLEQGTIGWVDQVQITNTAASDVPEVEALSGLDLYLEGDGATFSAGRVTGWAGTGDLDSTLGNFDSDANPSEGSLNGRQAVQLGLVNPSATPFEYLQTFTPARTVSDYFGGSAWSLFGAFRLDALSARAFNSARPEDCAMILGDLGLNWGLGLCADGIYAWMTDDDRATFEATPRQAITTGLHTFEVRYEGGQLTLQIDDGVPFGVLVGALSTTFAGPIGPGAFEVSTPPTAQQPDVAQVTWGSLFSFGRVLSSLERTGVYQRMSDRWGTPAPTIVSPTIVAGVNPLAGGTISFSGSATITAG